MFISYASQDAFPAERLRAALAAAGIEVWLDQSELRGGADWDREIRAQIRACALFMPLLSQNSLARHEGYFRLEWNLAEQRALMMGRGRAFVVPVCTEGRASQELDVPDVFLRTQWMPLTDEGSLEAIVHQVQSLLQRGAEVPASAPATSGDAGALPAMRPGHRRHVGWAAALGVAVLLAGAASFLRWHRPRSPAPAPVAGALPATGKSVAVLPFLDLSEKKDQEYFSDGLSEELIERLGQTSGLKVMARTSSFFFKGRQITIAQIAAALGVTHVLEGSVRKSGNHIRVTAQLIQAADGSPLWGQTYDRQFDDIFQVQDDITASVVQALAQRLSSAPAARTARAIRPAAYDQYLIGRAMDGRITTAACRESIAAYRKAIDLDPAFARPYAEISKCQTFLVNFGDSSASLADAQTNADRAIALAPDEPAGYLARVYLRTWGVLDAPGARADVEQAGALSPGDTEFWRRKGDVLALFGRLDEAIAAERKAVALDPLSGLGWSYLAIQLYSNHEYEESLKAFERQDALGFVIVNGPLDRSRLDILAGRPADALQRLSGYTAFERGRRQTIALAEFSLGHRDAAQAALRALQTDRSGKSDFDVAEVLAWSGNTERALDWLDRAAADHDPELAALRHSPFLESVRRERRYGELVARLRLQ